MQSICLFILLQFFALLVSAQEKKQGKLHINADPRIDSLLNISRRINEEKQSIPGYRVQVYFGSDRKKANEIKTGLLQKHSDLPAYVMYQQPHYKVRVGDYRTRIEAYKLSRQLSAEYPSAFIVRDDIALPPLEQR